jgi:hypothetical protein
MVDRAAVLAVHRDGLEALAGFGATAPDSLWGTTVCGVWDGADLAGHVLAVSGWYHEWLDRAEAGDTDVPFRSQELATRNQTALNALGPGTGPDRLAAFRRSAEAYLERVAPRWDLPFAFPFGVVTAGQHAAVAAMEWHAHAWDLARGAGGDHRPVDPDTLADAVVDAWARRRGPVRGAALRGLAPIARGASRDSWAFLLRNSGRRP